MEDRANPRLRGTHPDGIQASVAPSSRSECIDCGRRIKKNSPRWGIKYAGNPLTAGDVACVISLYGTHPMIMWCHAGGCGLRYQRPSASSQVCKAARVCHLCSDTPDDQLKLLCGGRAKGKKVRSHAFHIRCWKDAINYSTTLSDEVLRSILIDPSDIGGWDELSAAEQDFVLKCWN